MIQFIIDKTILSELGMWEARWLSSYIGQVQRRKKRKNDPRCWKWKHAGVILDGLDDCTRCGGIFTPAWPSVPPAPFTSTRLTDKRAVSQEPWWKPLFIGTQFPHFPLSRFLALGNICLQKFQEMNLTTLFLTRLGWNLAHLTQATTSATFVISSAHLWTSLSAMAAASHSEY